MKNTLFTNKLFTRKLFKTKLLKVFGLALLLGAGACSLQSCDNDDDHDEFIIDPYFGANAIVTVKTDSTSGLCYLQLNDSVRLLPTGMKESPFGNKEVRALALIRFTGENADKNYPCVFVDRLDSIRTKMMSPVVEDMEKVYGNDPLEIVNDWTTVSEDGYLTLRFRTYFGGMTPHTLRLVRTGDNTVTLYHDANGDVRGAVGDGIIAFRLNDLPDTEGKYKEFTLKWTSFAGEKRVTFKYKTRK